MTSLAEWFLVACSESLGSQKRTVMRPIGTPASSVQDARHLGSSKASQLPL
jgi:hypothetical protein